MAQGGYGGPPAGYPQQQPMAYQQPAPQPVHGGGGPGGFGSPGGAPAVGAQTKGFFSGLFDFSFETFVALKVIKVLYGLFLLLLALGILGGLGTSIMSMVQGEVLAGLGILIALPFAALLYLILGRVYFELIIVGFKIAEDADEIARNTRK
ncbi:MAG TPA: DUF4282 domain-containing protein [Polyangiaceae bacterium]